jgi:sulfate adenylyltransferase subunit 2
MNRIKELEAHSIYILREAYKEFKYKNLCMLWSIGKDSTVMLALTRKAFFGHIPFPLVHIDTHYKIPEMISYRNRLAMELKFELIYGENAKALEKKLTFPDGNVDRITCCRYLKSDALKNTLSGEWPRYRLNHNTGKFEIWDNKEPFGGVIVGIRADEEGSRSKERYFSPRGEDSEWNISEQPPEIWNFFNTNFPPKTHIRIHPLLDWTELDIWEYIAIEKIPVVSLYFNNGQNQRYRSLGCYPCTKPIVSGAKTVEDIVNELRTGKLSKIAERSGREQDKEDRGTLETLRKDGYM